MDDRLSVSWIEIEKKINNMQHRERRLLCISVVAVVICLQLLILWDPIYQSSHKSYKQSSDVTGRIKEAKETIEVLKKRANIDVNAQQKSKVSNLRQRIMDQQRQIESLTSALITPKNMDKVFTSLLKESKLSLEKISNVDAKSVKIDGQLEETNLLFQHGLSLELKGKYMSVLKYLQSLEEQDWQLYWDELEFNGEHYPRGVLNIEVHTLSTSDSLLDL